MPTLNKTILKTFSIIVLSIPILLSGCATKGAKRVYAKPYLIPRTVSVINQAVKDAPRTEPGKVMDPNAITFAQVPSRIVYLPGSGSPFNRTSGRQLADYRLVPVDRIPEIQSQKSPYFDDKGNEQTPQSQTNKDGQTSTSSTFRTAFQLPNSQIEKGTARRLGVMGKTEGDKERADSMLRRGETLKWSPSAGWVGFVAEEIEKMAPTQTKQQEIPEIKKAPPAGKAPTTDILSPISGMGAPSNNNQKNKNNDSSTKKQDKDTTGVIIE